MAELNLDLSQFSGITNSGMFYLLVIMACFVFLLVGIAFLIWFINRNHGIATKIDIAGRSKGGLVKNLPYKLLIFRKRGSGFSLESDKWGVIKVDGDLVTFFKFNKATAPAPDYNKLLFGNVMLAISPNVNEIRQVWFDEFTQELKAAVEWDMVGHAYNQQRNIISLFQKKSGMEMLMPYIALGGVVFAGLAVVFIVAKMGFDKLDTVANAVTTTGQAVADAAHTLANQTLQNSKPPV